MGEEREDEMKTKQKHPALTLFEKLFTEAAKDPGPYMPSYFVPRSAFIAELKKAGIEAPNNFIRYMEWEKQIGLRTLARKVIAKYHKDNGTSPTSMERGALRLAKRLEKLERK